MAHYFGALRIIAPKKCFLGFAFSVEIAVKIQDRRRSQCKISPFTVTSNASLNATELAQKLHP